MPDDTRQCLEALLGRRDKVREDIQRIKGRLDSARSDRTSIETECRQRGVEPEQLDTAIDQLEKRLADAVGDLETQIQEAESAVAPYLEER